MTATMPGRRDILVTGANGFIGAALCQALEETGRPVRRAVRRASPGDAADGVFVTGDLSGQTDWTPALAGAACIVHLAARTHVLHETGRDPLADYRRVNVQATERLARQAAWAGARRLVFVSSVKVHGETTVKPFTEDDAPRPEDAYGVSKWEAERVLHRIAAETGIEVVILRPPLVYGPGVKGNFLRLLDIVARGWPLPLASVDNRRSLIHVGNLADAIVKALASPRAAGRTYLVNDGEDVSTPDLIRAVAHALDVTPRLFPCPVTLLKAGAAMLGRGDEIARLTGSLQVSGSRIGSELGWRPSFTLVQGLAETARWYRER